MELLDLFQRFGVALAIGALIGVERGWKNRDAEDETRVAGFRTHILIALLGALAGALGQITGPAFLATALAAFALAWIVFKVLETQRDGDISVTGLVAGLIVFAIGAYAIVGDLQIAAAAGVATAGVLAFKEGLHAWLRLLTWPEIRAALLVFAATFIALPILPDRPLDPLGAFNPRSLWLLTILIASISFAGYIALRALGAKTGLFVSATIGALVSSTAVTLDLARRAKKGEANPLFAASAAALANVVMFARVGVLIAAFAQPAFAEAAPALAAALLVSLAAASGVFLFRHDDQGGFTKVENPLDVKFVAQIALLLTIVSAAAHAGARFFGDEGLIATSALAGLADIDAVALAVGAMAREGAIAPHPASMAILTAAVANSLSKSVIAAIAGGARFALIYGAITLASLAAGAVAFVLF